MSLDAEASRALLANWGAAEPDRNEVLQQIFELRAGARPAFSRAGFEGLRASNGIRLLRSGELRDSLLHYYEVVQPQFADYYFDVVWPRREQVNDALAPYVQAYPVANGGSLALRTSWPDLTGDPVLEHHLTAYHSSIAYSATFLEELQSTVGWLLGRARDVRSDSGT